MRPEQQKAKDHAAGVNKVIEWHQNLTSATIGIVTALPVELAAIKSVFGDGKQDHANGRRYSVVSVPRSDNSGSHTVVVCCLSEMGNSSAAAATSALLTDCKNVSVVVMCGIAGAIPNPQKPADHVRLGDIVASNQDGVVKYDHESVRESEVRIRPHWYRPSQTLLKSARELQTRENLGERPWDRHIQQALEALGQRDIRTLWERPGLAQDVLQEYSPRRIRDLFVKCWKRIPAAPQWFEYRPISHPRDAKRIDGAPRVFLGVIASADKLQKDPQRRDLLRETYSAMAVEMESSGVAHAVLEFDRNFYVVRGTVDYCNDHKNEAWHHYGALIAAAYTRALLEVTPAMGFLPASQADSAELSKHVSSISNQLYAVAEPVVDTDLTESADLAADPAARVLSKETERLSEEGRRRVAEIKGLLDAWEIASAIAAAQGLAVWTDEHRTQLPRPLLKDLFSLLARVELAKASQKREEDRNAELARATQYIARAKDVG